MTYNYRCTRSSCRMRKTFKKRLEEYVKDQRCSCGGEYRHDPAVKARNKQLVCRCDGIIYPHRVGTEPWCNYAKVGPTDKDWEERYRNVSY